MESSLINLGNSITLNVKVEGTGKPLVMIHGNGEDLSVFDESASILFNYYKVIRFDSRNHGQSSKVSEMHYMDIAADVVKLIEELDLNTCIVYGFSDGGIVALLLAIHFPHLIDSIIISGVNVYPKGLKTGVRWIASIQYLLTRNANLKMMLSEPNITIDQLHKIKCQVLMTSGKKDLIARKHTLWIHENIQDSQWIELPGGHSDNIVHSPVIAKIILNDLISRENDSDRKY